MPRCSNVLQIPTYSEPGNGIYNITVSMPGNISSAGSYPGPALIHILFYSIAEVPLSMKAVYLRHNHQDAGVLSLLKRNIEARHCIKERYGDISDADMIFAISARSTTTVITRNATVIQSLRSSVMVSHATIFRNISVVNPESLFMSFTRTFKAT